MTPNDGKRKFVFYSLVVVLFLSLLLLLGVGVSLFAFILVSGEEKFEEERDVLYKYQYIKRDISNNLTSVGIVEILHPLEDNFVSYQDSSGNQVLISDFESERYECTGKCYCDESRRALPSSIPIIKGVMLLVASVSSLLAFNVAREKYQEYCVEKVSEDECPSHAVRAEVDDCNQLISKEDVNKDGNIQKDYQCSGNCVPFPYFDGINGFLPRPDGEIVITEAEVTGSVREQYSFLRHESDSFKCEKLHFTNTYETKFEMDEFQLEEYLGQEGVELRAEVFNKEIEKQFMLNDLTAFCAQRSMITPPIISQEFYKLSTDNEVGFRFPLCMGNLSGENPSVKCIETTRLGTSY